MSTAVTPHLNFRGQAREALAFYRDVFGGEVVVVRYADLGVVGTDEPTADHVVWGQVESPDGFRVMAHDLYPHLPYERGTGDVYVSVRGTDEDVLRAQWDRLAEGATVTVDLAPAAWAPLYGMLTDRYGVTWVLDVAAPYAG